MNEQPHLRIGVRFEFYVVAAGTNQFSDSMDYKDADLVAALYREDLIAAAVPSPGDRIAQHTFRQPIHEIIGGSPRISEVEHYIREPHETAARDPLPMVVCRIVTPSNFNARFDETKEELRAQEWIVQDFREHVRARSS